MATEEQLQNLETDLDAADAAIRAVVDGGLHSFRIQTTVSEREYEHMDLAQLRRHRAWILREIDKCKVELGQRARRRTGWRKVKSVFSK